MNITKHTSQIDFVKSEDQFFSSQENEAAIVILRKTEVIYGADDSCNTEWCDQNNVAYIHQDKLFTGGCIVGVAGNIFVDVKMKTDGGESITDQFAKALGDYLREKGLKSVRQDNNDVLVDGFKVASGCETEVDGWRYMGYQISLRQNMEVIQGACNKQMIKIPKGLKEYGITTEEMVEFCEQYWSNFDK